jgi:ParB family chromosome partitioning protein
VLSAGHARAILALDDDEAMERLATRVVAEGLSVRATEEIVAVGEGGKPPRARRTRTSKPTPIEVVDVVDRLSELLETRVTASGSARGRLVIEYASLEDLHRIVEVIESE